MSRIATCYVCDRRRPIGCLAIGRRRSTVFPYAMEDQLMCDDSCALPYVLTRPCEACGLKESMEGDIDCEACAIDGDLDAVNIELEMMA